MARGVGVLAAACVVLVVASAAAAPLQAPPPETGLTVGQAEGAFVRAALAQCLGSRETGVMISDLPPEIRGDLHPARRGDSILISDPNVPNWISSTLGGLMVVSEPSPDRCGVIAMQLPVDPTFQMVLQTNARSPQPLTAVPVKPGYNPIAYQLERVADGRRYIVHLEGANPGGAAHPLAMAQGHAFRFSLLHAWIARQPADAKPLFR